MVRPGGHQLGCSCHHPSEESRQGTTGLTLLSSPGPAPSNKLPYAWGSIHTFPVHPAVSRKAQRTPRRSDCSKVGISVERERSAR